MSTTPYERVMLTPQDRVLIAAPHPDDEVLGCTSIIQQAVEMELPVRIVFFTYGDLEFVDPISMGLVRHNEAFEAAKVLKLSPENLIFLGYPDFGTEDILYTHWGDNPPYRGLLTKVTEIPYANALRPGALYKGEEILKDFKTVIHEFRPTKIFLSHPADFNVDHRALYVFILVALWDLELGSTPELYPYLIHYSNWPQPQGYYPTESLEPPLHLRDQILWKSHVSSLNNLKLQALKKHKTQYSSDTKYLLSFVRANELFGDFPLVKLATSLQSIMVKHHPNPSEELTAAERIHFAGFKRYGMHLQGDNLVFSIKLSGLLARDVEVSVCFFGYRTGRPFAEMPKLQVSIGDFGYAVYDQKIKLPEDAVQIFYEAKEITMCVPLKIVGNPRQMLTSLKIRLGEAALDCTPWRVLDLTCGEGSIH